MPQVAVKISEPIFAKLRSLAHQQHTNYASIIEAALSSYEPETSQTASHGASEIHLLIESALQPVLARLEMLESLGLVKHQHLSGVTVQINTQEADLSDSDEQPIEEPRSAEKAPEIAPQAARDRVKKEPSSIPALPPIRDAVAEIKRRGLTPQQATDELNRRGYRTKNNTEIQRGWVNNTMKGMN